MNYEFDLHTHTIASGHAYSTIKEMAHSAAQKGLKLLGITEHAPKMPGTCHDFYFKIIGCSTAMPMRFRSCSAWS